MLSCSSGSFVLIPDLCCKDVSLTQGEIPDCRPNSHLSILVFTSLLWTMLHPYYQIYIVVTATAVLARNIPSYFGSASTGIQSATQTLKNLSADCSPQVELLLKHINQTWVQKGKIAFTFVPIPVNMSS